MSAVSRFDLVVTKVFAGLVAALAVAVPVWLVGLWATGQPLPWTSCTIADGPQYSAQAHYLGELEWRIADASTGQWLGVIGVATIGAASVLVALGALLGLVAKVPTSGHLDRSTISYWGDVALGFEPAPDAGPIVVSIDYEVAAENQAAFVAAIEGQRRSRLRTGSSRWELFRVGEDPTHVVELFWVSSWEEHLLQHDGRLTPADQEAEDAVAALVVGTPVARHLLPPPDPQDPR